MRHFDFEHRVTYAETDTMGYVYYANYLVYFEIGRTEFVRSSGMTYKQLEDMGYMLPVLEASCKYHRPAKYDDVLTIRTSVSDFKGIRLGFYYEILRDGVKLVEGTTLHAFVNPDGRPRKLSNELQEKLKKAFI